VPISRCVSNSQYGVFWPNSKSSQISKTLGGANSKSSQVLSLTKVANYDYEYESWAMYHIVDTCSEGSFNSRGGGWM
jgi:hypothetical protein